MTLSFRRYLSWWDFYGYLSEFEKSVHDGAFHKMDYHTWRKLKWDRDNETQVIIERRSSCFVVIIDHENEYHRFYYGDESFGDFLLKKDYEHNLNGTYKISSVATIAEDSLTDIDVSSTLSCVIDAKVDKEDFNKRLDDLTTKVENVLNKYENKKENSTMKGFNFDFGPMNNNVVRMSVYGMAVKNKAGTWVSYDAKAGEIMDVDVFNFDGSKFMYKMPVAINDVSIGDVIIHMSIPMFIVGKSEDGKAVYAVDPVAGERKEIMLTKSPFGFNFVTKVVNFLGNTFNADASNPFGNLGLMMMLSDDNKGMGDMLPLMMLSGNVPMDSNMLMMLAMSNSEKTNDMLPFMLMMNANKPATSHVCNCGQHNQ